MTDPAVSSQLLALSAIRTRFDCGSWRTEDVDYLFAAIELLRQWLLRQWVSDLQSGMYINCVYCGHRYGPQKDTPAVMADALKQHIATCPEHPMSKCLAALKSGRDLLEASLAHVSHGGPSRADAQRCLSEVQAAINSAEVPAT